MTTEVTSAYTVRALFGDAQVIELHCPADVIRSLIDRLGAAPVVTSGTVTVSIAMPNGQLLEVNKSAVISIEENYL